MGLAHEDREGGFDYWWAHNKEEMKEVFSSFIDWTYDRWLQDKSMHVTTMDILRLLPFDL